MNWIAPCPSAAGPISLGGGGATLSLQPFDYPFGDSTIDLLTAHAAGTRACIVRYGFGFAAFDRAQLRGGEVFADHPADVAALLLDRRNGH